MNLVTALANYQHPTFIEFLNSLPLNINKHYHNIPTEENVEIILYSLFYDYYNLFMIKNILKFRRNFLICDNECLLKYNRALRALRKIKHFYHYRTYYYIKHIMDQYKNNPRII